MPRPILAGAMLIGALALGSPALDAQNAVTVDMQEFSFQPHEWTVTPGTAVRWVNRDDSPHHVVTEAKLVDSGAIGPGATFEFTFTQPGRFAYRCAIHPTMLGIVTVRTP